MKIETGNKKLETRITSLRIKMGESKVLNNVWLFEKSGETGEILIKAVVEDGGSFEAKGMLKIAKGIKDVNVFLRYRVLLLGASSRAIVEPQLEIESNEIKAGHAASIGRVDEEQVFYLMSRGMSRKKAIELIVETFLL